MDTKSTIDAAHPRFLKKEEKSNSGFRIGLIQLSVGTDKTKNIERAVQRIESAKANGAQLIALPECFNSPYGTKYFNDYAEEIPNGPTSKALSDIASELKVHIIGGTIPERDGNRLFNTCTVWNADGKLIAKHRKVHLFDIDIPGKITFKESEVLAAGDQLTTFQYENTKIGLGVCYDLRFEEMAKMYSKQDCSMLIYPGAFNMTTGPKHWELLGRARATDNQCWTALVSPARDETASYIAWGHSSLINPWGEVVAKLDDKEGVLFYDVDLAMVGEVRSQIPIRHQRRTDLYDTISYKK